MELRHSFHVADYLVFFATIGASLGIGVYFAVAGQRTTGQYLLGNRKINPIPVAISLLISYISAVTLIGNASEMYLYGIHYWFYIFAVTIAMVLNAVLFVPLFHPLKITSVQEYLRMRFESRVVEMTSSMLQLLSLIIMNGVFLFGPCVMLQTFTGIPVWSSMLITGIVATIYTTIGGFKAVIWADVFQTVIILIGLLVIVIQGTILAGGPSQVWETFNHGGRLELIWDPSPTHRMSVWTAGVVFSVQWLAYYAVLQPSAQRFCAVESLSAARGVVLGVIPGVWFLGTLACASGIVAYAYFTQVGCDPYRAGFIENQNQITPFFVMELINYPSVPGLFLACVFCGSLSNLSSFLNGSAALLWHDLLSKRLHKLSEFRKTLVTKLMALVCGILTICMGFIVASLGGTLNQIIFTITGTSLAPVMTLFVLGAAFPRVNWLAAELSVFVSFGIPIWLAMGSIVRGKHTEPLPTVTTNCSTFWGPDIYNNTEPVTMVTTQQIHVTTDLHLLSTSFTNNTDTNDSGPWLDTLYSISGYWFLPIGIIIGVTFGLLLSLIPGFKEKEPIKSELLFPFVRRLLRRKEVTANDYELAKSGVDKL